jgi:uncharacterized protein (DUF433 family)
MDWTGCEFVEVVSGKVSGRPLVVGTRIPADLVIEYLDHGTSVEEILDNYPGLSREIVERLGSFANSRRMRVAS